MRTPLALLRSHSRLAILFVLAGGLAFWWLRIPPIDVEAATVDAGPLRVTIDEPGITRFRRHAVVSAPVSGYWIPDPFDEGDVMAVGARLGIMRAAPLDATVQRQMQARVVITETGVREVTARRAATLSGLREAQRTYDRLVRIAEAGGASPQQVEQALHALVQAQQQQIGLDAQLRAAMADRDATRAMLQNRQAPVLVTAPIGGRLLRRLEPHARVLPAGTPLAELGMADDLDIVVPVLTSEVGRIREQATATVSFGMVERTNDSDPGDTARLDTLHGVVHRIDPAAFMRISALGVEEQRVNVVVRVARADLQRRPIGDQFRVETRITVSEMPRVLRIPVGALVRDDTTWFVWRIDGGRVSRRRIVTGARNATHAAVLSGLSPGDRIVVYPGEQVDERIRVHIRASTARRSP